MAAGAAGFTPNRLIWLARALVLERHFVTVGVAVPEMGRPPPDHHCKPGCSHTGGTSWPMAGIDWVCDVSASRLNGQQVK
jgi:hypothetical protein